MKLATPELAELQAVSASAELRSQRPTRSDLDITTRLVH